MDFLNKLNNLPWPIGFSYTIIDNIEYTEVLVDNRSNRLVVFRVYTNNNIDMIYNDNTYDIYSMDKDSLRNTMKGMPLIFINFIVSECL